MIGEIISHYKILEKLGEGGMGEIYKAEDLKLKRIVAIKVLPESFLEDEESKRRFINEAQAASSLQHNNICTIHEVDETENGQLFICMDFYKGETLEQKIKKRPINVEDALNYAIQIAEGLSKAHQINIIHRDIKPGNIFITNEGVAKILDFGLVKNDNQTQLTKLGATVGTISYMSPEQSMGEDVDIRTDIWSLGIVLYEMLTGQRPFKGDYDQAIIYSILNEEPKSITDSNPKIPIEFEKIISKLLSKDKPKRYSSLDDLIIDLKNISGVEPSTSKHFLRFNKKVILISFVILAIISVSVLLYISISSEKSIIAKKSISILAFENQTGDTSYNYLRTAVPNLLITNLEQSKLFIVTTWERLRDLLKQSGGSNITEINKEQGFKLCKMDNVNAIALGSITKAGNYFVTDVKLLDVTSKKLITSVNAKGEGIESILNSQIDEISRSIVSNITDIKTDDKTLPISIIELTTNSLEAYNYYLRGNDDFAVLDWATAAKNYLRATDIDSNFAMAYNNLAVCYSYLNKFNEMRLAIKKALLLTKNISNKERLFIEGQYEILIKQDLQRAVGIYNELSIEFPKDKRIILYKAFCLDRLNQKEEAIKNLKDILKLDPTFGVSLNLIGYQYLRNNNPDSAKKYLDRQLEAYPHAANSFDALGDYYLIAGNLKFAENYYNRTLNIDDNLSSTKIKLAYLFALKENFDTAKKIIQNEIGQTTELNKSMALKWLAYYQFLTRNYKESFELLDSARQIGVEKNYKTRVIQNSYLRAWFNLEINNFHSSENYFNDFILHLDDGVIKQTETLIYESYKKLKQNKLDSISLNISKISNLVKNLSPSQKSLYKDGIERVLNHLQVKFLLAQDHATEALNVFQSFSPRYSFHFYEKKIIENLIIEKDIRARCYNKMNRIKDAINEYENLIYRKEDKYKVWVNNPIYHYRLAKLYENQNFFSNALKEYKIFQSICKNGDESDNSLIDCKNKIVELSKFEDIKND